MISSLKGTIKVKNSHQVVIEVHDIGYQVFVGERTARECRQGEVVTLYTYQHLRENASELYGFLANTEVDFFKRLIGLPGVGPKSAMNVMDVASLTALVAAIQSGDTKLLTKAVGIGQRTANRITVELKDKLDFRLPASANEPQGEHAEAAAALEGLGFSAAEAREALRQVPPKLKNAEEIVKAALKNSKR